MPVIHLVTKIHAPVELCFDLSRSIDLHKISTEKTNEKAIAGVQSGLITLNETVTWEAVHFGIRQRLTTKITKFERPYFFRDEQLKGAFRYFNHDHTFRQENENVIMTDRFEFASPFGWVGKLFDRLVLTRYMTKFLQTRNAVIKDFCESEKWKKVL